MHREIPLKGILVFNSGSVETRLKPKPNKGICELPFCFVEFVGWSLSLYSGTQKELSSSWNNIQQRETRADVVWLTRSQVHNKCRDCTWGSVRFLDSDKVGWKTGVEINPIIHWVL